MFKRLITLASTALLAACASYPPLTTSTSQVRYQSAQFADLPGWGGPLAGESLTALKASCRTLQGRPQWQGICADSGSIDAANPQAVRSFYESRFTPWQLLDSGKDSGLITGYYEPLLAGSRSKSAQTPYPVYGTPADLYVLDITAEQRVQPQLVARRSSGNRLQLLPGKSVAGSGEIQISLADFVTDNRTRALKGRIDGNRLLPYYTRAEINAGKGNDKMPVLAWVEDETELFFLQVQGSGRIQLEDGSFIRVGYADQNGHGYKSIGRWLVDQGQMRLEDVSMQNIKAWISAHPQRRAELFAANPSYVFFKPLPANDSGPLGALGVPLTSGYSVAVDPRYIPLGAPVYLATTWPLDGTPQPLNRLVHAQDTGGAIRGGVRADFFFGYGAEAGMYAGRMKQSGKLWLLLPNGMTPAAAP
ncbi:murein transglycosylase A [Vogesella sp. LIG4]|uniref:murein transglycosylase A n=1 Tax=Vogesella sp. LIG4 TaxID=1192162 RepID=UPI00082004B1|nr:MltA domain-containing protein [Vogesella sp. LIG4]SCK07429.1 membrane-bound lytic murein transglycosylase A [Vogesella sp. LIG4]